jgi:hypothetical protein
VSSFLRLFQTCDPVHRFCERLGRPHAGARLLDHIADWLIGVPRRPAWAGSPYGPEIPVPLLAVNVGPEPPTQQAPTEPDETMNEANQKACAEPRYRGMHGRPCRFAGGTDTRCPKGTVSGWFWKYRTPAGVFYYVDCCGATPGGQAVWCTWVDEQNWCLGYGGGWSSFDLLKSLRSWSIVAGDGRHGLAAAKKQPQYGCTLTISETDLVVAKVNDPKVTDHEFFQVMGVDS